MAADNVIKLPAPNLDRNGHTVMKALSQRCSSREFNSKALSMNYISDLLWAANGINRADGKRTAPSALNKQDVDIYVVLPKGIYLYQAKDHSLKLIKEGDYRNAVVGGQDFVNDAPLSLLLVSNVSLFGDSSLLRNQLMGAVDIGTVSQNISLFCTFAGLSTVPRASMDSEQLRKLLHLTEGQLLLMNHPVGYPRK